MERIVIFAATSAIARAVAEEYLARGEALLLAGRSAEGLRVLARDLEVLGGKPVPWIAWDVLDFENHTARFRELTGSHAVKGLFMAAGIQIPQGECDRDPSKTALTFHTNLTGPAAIIGLFAAHFRQKGAGFISCLSSVAGDRGRGSITAYAASKAGLSAYLEGLANRLKNTGVLVQTVKPGYVRTPMTEGLRSPLVASPAFVARDIVNAVARRRESIYTPFYWKYIMRAVRAVPEPLFRKLGL
jgi:decaprenylphospho-beta-D-erythro-pentofuranosid-2-ulose 2-reductase